MNLPSVVRNGSVWEPPYAHLLRQLGLFDPIEIPRHAVNRYDSSFPVVVHSARVLQQPRSYKEGNEAIRDIRHIIDPISETFGQTTRWAVGSLFGQLRNAMDYVESSIQRPGEEQNRDNKRQQAEESIDPSALVRAIRSDLIVNFDRMFPESDKDIRSSYYQVSSRTMPDGSIETRKVVRDNGGTETTTVTKQYPDSSKNDERTVTSTEYDLSGPDTSDREK
ncbi:hypothetical protein LPJ59_005065 [Coemansia sp. RSA 2399]|nr:hypothetical protein LPJ59_005065 [Coemansia sp. RSA 2399]KAJ1895808.1 hypothetical protein LPJ81_004880 [Coemansia sp. IMI 209127]